MEEDIQRAFVAGAKWLEYYKTKATMRDSDIGLAEEEAKRRYSDECNCEVRAFTVFHKPGCKHYE